MDFNLKNLCDFLVDLKTMMFSLSSEMYSFLYY